LVIAFYWRVKLLQLAAHVSIDCLPHRPNSLSEIAIKTSGFSWSFPSVFAHVLGLPFVTQLIMRLLTYVRLLFLCVLFLVERGESAGA